MSRHIRFEASLRFLALPDPGFPGSTPKGALTVACHGLFSPTTFRVALSGFPDFSPRKEADVVSVQPTPSVSLQPCPAVLPANLERCCKTPDVTAEFRRFLSNTCISVPRRVPLPHRLTRCMGLRVALSGRPDFSSRRKAFSRLQKRFRIIVRPL